MGAAVLSGCVKDDLRDDPECPMTAIEPPGGASEVVDATVSSVPLSRSIQVAWEYAPNDVSAGEVVLVMVRAPSEVVWVDHGVVNLSCQVGTFLQVPYELEVEVDGGEAMASGPAVVQATNSPTPALVLLTSVPPFFGGPPLTTTVSSEWENAASDRFDATWTSWTWQLSVIGSLDDVEHLSVSIDLAYESASGSGSESVWGGHGVSEL